MLPSVFLACCLTWLAAIQPITALKDDHEIVATDMADENGLAAEIVRDLQQGANERTFVKIGIDLQDEMPVEFDEMGLDSRLETEPLTTCKIMNNSSWLRFSPSRKHGLSNLTRAHSLAQLVQNLINKYPLKPDLPHVKFRECQISSSSRPYRATF